MHGNFIANFSVINMRKFLEKSKDQFAFSFKPGLVPFSFEPKLYRLFASANRKMTYKYSKHTITNTFIDS
jgi:hypothetical protein